MSPSIGLLVIHGMGDQPEHFADELFAGIRRHLDHDADLVAYESCLWADVLQHHQDQVWQRLRRSGAMSWPNWRTWLLSSFGDPPAYLSGYFKSGRQAYGIIHGRVREALTRLETQFNPRNSRPLVVLAHSLGSVIITNYIWDEQKSPTPGSTPFERTETLTKLVTYGSNIPLFLPPVRPIECIQFPWPSLPEHIRPLARWLNVYAPSDLLGYPLSGLWDNSHGTIVDDHAFPVGPWPLSRTPLSHTRYDSDDGFLSMVAAEIRSLVAPHGAGAAP